MEVTELGRETVKFSALVQRAAEDSYLALKELVEKGQKGDELGQQRSDSEKKIDLLKFIARTRQRMLRLHVLAKWCQQVRNWNCALIWYFLRGNRIGERGLYHNLVREFEVVGYLLAVCGYSTYFMFCDDSLS